MPHRQLSPETVEELEFLLRTISGIVRRKGREILVGTPITPPQFEVLLLLKEHGDLTIGEVGNKMFLAYSTTTDLVDRMERNGLVERVRDKEDRRVVRLHMRDMGREFIEQVLQTRRAFLESVLVGWDEDSLIPLLQFLGTIAKKMENK